MRKFATIILAALFTLNLAVAARAEDGDRGSVTALFGAKGSGMVNYHLGDKLDLIGGYEDYQYKAGFHYRPWGEPIGFKAGVRSGEKERETAAYGGLDFLIPFGTNLKLTGFYDTGYKGPDWNRYEAAVRIQMYDQAFLYAGIRGENGSGMPDYDYNDGEALLFLRGDIGWKWDKVELRLQPTMHIQGDYFHNYELKYHFNDQTAALLSVNSEYDETVRVRMGFEYKF